MATAEAEIDEALELFRSVGDRRGEAWALQNLAWIAFIQGESDQAEARLGLGRERSASSATGAA